MLSNSYIDRLRFAAHWRLQKLSALLAPATAPSASAGAGALPNPEDVFASITVHLEAARMDALSSAVLLQARLSIIDTLACVFAGMASDEGRSILAVCNMTKEALLDSTKAPSPQDHAFLMAALAQIHDFNDGLENAEKRGGAFHPGRVLIPTALAVGLRQAVTGRELLTAIALGYDLACFTNAKSLNTPGDAYGAAGCAAWLKKLDRTHTAFAIRTAALMSPVSGAKDFETNNLTIAQQAASGVLATELVQDGYPNSRARKTYLQGSRFAFTKPESPGDAFNLLYRKPYPCCRDIHRAIDAALQLRASAADLLLDTDGKTRVSRIDSIEIELPETRKGPVFPLNPGEYYKCYQFSIPYVIAAALVDGAITLEQFEDARTGDPTIHELQAKIRLLQGEGTASESKFARIAVHLSTGETLRSECTEARGSPSKPLNENDLFEKLRKCADRADINVEELIRRLQTLETADNVSDHLAL
ncbi:MAG: MmgE/PrpD family protein [Pseudomonadota bacterium]